MVTLNARHLRSQNIENIDFTGKILQSKHLADKFVQLSIFARILQNIEYEQLSPWWPTIVAAKYCQRRTYTQNILE